MRRPDAKEFDKFVDDSILFREREETQGRLRLSLFIAALGPISIGLLKWTNNLPVGRTLGLAILCAPAVAGVLMLINYARAEGHAKKHPATLRIILYTVACGVGTYVAAAYFSLLSLK
jgi:hypothetical protein